MTHDAEDGYDTVEWAAKLPNSDGKVGTFGMSYRAQLQWRLAPLRPPSLVAMSACSAMAHFDNEHGAFRPLSLCFVNLFVVFAHATKRELLDQFLVFMLKVFFEPCIHQWRDRARHWYSYIN